AEPALAELGDRAEEDDPLDVERADQRGDRPAERRPGSVDDLDGPGLARVDRPADRREVGRAAGDAGRAGFDRPHAGHGLEAADPAAPAKVAVVVDDRVADLAGARAVALEQRAPQDQAGTDAPTDADRDQVRDAALAGVGV